MVDRWLLFCGFNLLLLWHPNLVVSMVTRVGVAAVHAVETLQGRRGRLLAVPAVTMVMRHVVTVVAVLVVLHLGSWLLGRGLVEVWRGVEGVVGGHFRVVLRPVHWVGLISVRQLEQLLILLLRWHGRRVVFNELLVGGQKPVLRFH